MTDFETIYRTYFRDVELYLRAICHDELLAEELTEQVDALLREQGVKPYILSTQACAICDRCAILDDQPCRFPEKMHPCVESHGINVVPILERLGLEFQFGSNVVTWISLLLF